jgi:signal transduction histidine kinase
LGDDPTHPGSKKPFSAAHIEIMGKSNCYVYVILTGAQYEDVATMVRGSYIFRTGGRSLGLIILATIALGLLLFAQLTRRLRAINATVAEFAQGHYETRASDKSRDELGQLATSFNQMADTIEENVATLRNVDSARREMIANISHDLRSPLSSMQGYLETIALKAEDLSAEEREGHLEIILRNTRSLSTMIEELFELSRLDADQIVPRKEAFSLAELIQDLVLQYRSQAEDAGLSVEADLPDRSDLVYGDVGLIERAMTNLIDNAIRFTPSGGRIVVSLTSETDTVTVRVQDNGPGIPAEDVPYIFDRFYKADESRNKEKGGTGLGLAIARRILHLHDSELHVESVSGEGTVFYFSLSKYQKSS